MVTVLSFNLNTSILFTLVFNYFLAIAAEVLII
jgi:hypothetical protein